MNRSDNSMDRGESFRIGAWLVEPELFRISNGDGDSRIEPRMMGVLACLAARAGTVVSRKELHGAVWGKTVVCEQTLTRVIWELRKALGDDHRSPAIIETIRKGGYRIIAPVSYCEETAQGAPPNSSGDRTGLWRRWRTPVFRSLFPVLLLAIAASLYFHFNNRSGAPVTPGHTSDPLTSLPGRERFPAISPDGMKVAFSWNGEEGDNYDLYLKQINTESFLRITDDPRDELYAAWSPDGSSIAFARTRADGMGYDLCTIPSIGGEVHCLADELHGLFGLDWSPDGEWIAYSSFESPHSGMGIELISTGSGEKRRLTAPAEHSTRDFWPRFSPDGRSVAFHRSGNLALSEIFLVPTDGGSPRQLTSLLCQMAGMDWSVDGKQLILSLCRGRQFGLWTVSAQDGSSLPLPGPFLPALFPSISCNTGRFVYENYSVDYDVYRVNLGQIRGEEIAPVPLISSTRFDGYAEYSPDGSSIAFLSSRAGNFDVWLCDRDGGNPRRLTSMKSIYTRSPFWSPDGSRIAFSSFQDGYDRVFTIGADGGAVRRLSTAGRNEIVNGWSRDGEWIYIQCVSDSGAHMARMRSDGTATAPLGIASAALLFESGEGELFYFKEGEKGIWKARPDGSGEDYAVHPDDMCGWQDMVVAEEGVYFIGSTAEGEELSLYSFAGGDIETLLELQGAGSIWF